MEMKQSSKIKLGNCLKIKAADWTFMNKLWKDYPMAQPWKKLDNTPMSVFLVCLKCLLYITAERLSCSREII